MRDLRVVLRRLARSSTFGAVTKDDSPCKLSYGAHHNLHRCQVTVIAAPSGLWAPDQFFCSGVTV